MKSRLLIIFAIGIIGFTGIAFAIHDPNQSQIHSIILPPELKEKTFEEFMEWCEPNYGELCIELEEKLIPNILSHLKQFKSGILIDEIQCKESLILLLKYDGSPTCVTIQTAEILKHRGWADRIMNNFCFGEHLPVCGEDNVTYGNQCYLERENVGLKHVGECNEN